MVIAWQCANGYGSKTSGSVCRGVCVVCIHAHHLKHLKFLQRI